MNWLIGTALRLQRSWAADEETPLRLRDCHTTGDPCVLRMMQALGQKL